MATFSDKIRIRLKAYDHKLLDQMSARSGARAPSPLPLPPLQLGGAAAARAHSPRAAQWTGSPRRTASGT